MRYIASLPAKSCQGVNPHFDPPQAVALPQHYEMPGSDLWEIHIHKYKVIKKIFYHEIHSF